MHSPRKQNQSNFHHKFFIANDKKTLEIIPTEIFVYSKKKQNQKPHKHFKPQQNSFKARHFFPQRRNGSRNNFQNQQRKYIEKSYRENFPMSNQNYQFSIILNILLFKIQIKG